MKGRAAVSISATLLLTTLATGAPPSHALAAQHATVGAGISLSPRAAKGVLKSSRTAMQSGRLAEALKGYESVLASRASAQDSRAEALYWAGMLRLSADPAMRDLDRARAYLGELKVFHAASGRQDEAGIVLALTEEIGDLRRSAASRRSERDEAVKDGEACRQRQNETGDRLRTLETENESLKTSDSALRAEILGLRDDIKRKDEALKKVKEVVVGWKTPR